MLPGFQVRMSIIFIAFMQYRTMVKKQSATDDKTQTLIMKYEIY